MKIHEIISYNNEINEANWKSTAISGIASLLGKSSDDILKYIMSLIDHNTGKISSSLSAADRALIDKYPKLAKKAENAFQKNMAKAKNAENMAFIKYKLRHLTSVFDFIKNEVTPAKAWWYVVMLTPLWDYYNELNAAMEEVKSGNWSSEKYEQYRTQQTAVLIGKISEQFLIRKVTTNIPIISKLLEKFKLSTLAQAAFMSYVNTKEGTDAISAIMISPILTGVFGGLGTKAIDTLTNKAKELAGSDNTSSQNNKIGGSSPVQKPQEPSTNTGISQQPNTDQPSTSSNIEYGKTWDY